ncbi:MAG: acyltransferase [Candidatus Magnetominusculus sp. LBB02]|nr:acyltransferase [Candidatus Magnetominusculus sp. LBB02]
MRSGYANERSRDRFYEIDLLRFIAALSVVFFHYGFHGYLKHKTDMPYLYFAQVAKYGYFAIYLFFIISGFVILKTAMSSSARGFVISRVVRLYPAFWVSCSVTSIISILAGDSRYHVSLLQYAINMTMFSGFFDNIHYIDGVYWTLTIEIKFYGLVLVVLILNQIHKAKELLGLWLVLNVLWSIFHYGEIISLNGFAPLFIAGGMFYLIRTEGFSVYKIIIIAMCYLLSLKGAYRQCLGMANDYRYDFSGIVVVIIISVFFVMFLLITMRCTTSLFSKRWLIPGAITYPLYLIHQNAGLMIVNLGYQHINAHIIMVCILTTMLLAAYIIHNKVEKPLSKRMKTLLNRLLRVRESTCHDNWQRHP